jgi:phage anti-repressor protein
MLDASEPPSIVLLHESTMINLALNENISSDITTLLDGWIKAEQGGIQFPVPFNLAWSIAGYSRKDHAKRRLLNKKSRLVEGRDYLPTSGECSQEGRFGDSIQLTCDAFKQFCLLAETEEGDNIRQYFIDAEKKWRLVQEVAPQIAQEVELLKIKRDIATQEAIAAVAQEKALALRHLVLTTMPEVKQQIVLGFQVVEKIEYRDRVIVNNQVVDEGDTINKTGLCDRYDIKTRNGKPDYKRLNALLEGASLPTMAWEETTTIQSNYQLRREYLNKLDRHMVGTTQQMHLGE